MSLSPGHFKPERLFVYFLFLNCQDKFKVFMRCRTCSDTSLISFGVLKVLTYYKSFWFGLHRDLQRSFRRKFLLTQAKVIAYLIFVSVSYLILFFQINRVSSWIDGSFIYSTSEAWVTAMRTFENGTFKSDDTGKLPVKNTMRVPLFNQPVPHVLRTLSPERLFCKIFIIYLRYTVSHRKNT